MESHSGDRAFVGSIVLRPYRQADLRSVVETYVMSIHALAAPYYTPEQLVAWAPANPDIAKWGERLEALHTLVAESVGQLAGFLSYNDEGYLDLLFVRPSYTRLGVASKLYRHAESVWRRLGVTFVTTHASLAARAFFERQGFQVQEEEEVECRGASLRRFTMAKALEAPKTENK